MVTITAKVVAEHVTGDEEGGAKGGEGATYWPAQMHSVSTCSHDARPFKWYLALPYRFPQPVITDADAKLSGVASYVSDRAAAAVPQSV